MNKDTYDFIANGTAYIPIFVEENYQLTYESSDINIPDVSLLIDTNMSNIEDEEQEIKIVVIDQEISILEDDFPPNLIPISGDAGILNIR